MLIFQRDYYLDTDLYLPNMPTYCLTHIPDFYSLTLDRIAVARSRSWNVCSVHTDDATLYMLHRHTGSITYDMMIRFGHYYETYTY